MPTHGHKRFLRKDGKESTIRQTFRSNLRNRRRQVGMYQWELAERLGLARSWIQRIEGPSSDAVPNLYQLESLAAELGSTVHDMLTPGKYGKEVGVNEDQRSHQRR